MPEDLSNVQSVIDKIASNLDDGNNKGNPGEDNEANGVDDPDNPKQGDEDDPAGDGQPGVDNPDPNKASNKDVAAFAAMRVAKTNAEKEVERLKAELAAKEVASKDVKDPAKKVEPEGEEKPDYVVALEKQVEELKKANERTMTERKQTIIAGQLIELKETYSLDKQALMDFANDAQKKGIALDDTHMSMVDAYRLVYHDKIIAAEVAKVQAAINGDVKAPITGVKGQSTGAGGSPKTMNDIISSLEEKLKK